MKKQHGKIRQILSRTNFRFVELVGVGFVILVIMAALLPVLFIAKKRANLPVSVDYDGVSVKYKKVGYIDNRIKMYKIEVDGKKYLLFSRTNGGALQLSQ